MFGVVWFGVFVFFSFLLEELFTDEGWIESVLYCTSTISN